MNNTQEHEILPMSKKDRRYRIFPYQHFKAVKKKFAGLRKHQRTPVGDITLGRGVNHE